ncbi:MAG: uroporphyrinogen-III synthase [Pseudomonadota bacterium]
MRIAVTRSEPDASHTSERLRALGAEAVLAPLLVIETRAFDATLDGVQALLFTSANGVRAFAERSAAREIVALTVGDATAEAARACGFREAHSADGDVATLAAFVQHLCDPKRGRLVHIAGADVAGDLVGALTSAGFDAERRVAYEAVAVTQAPAVLLGDIDLVLFHSARAARVYAALGAPRAAERAAACLSPAVAEAVQNSPDRSIPWARIIVSPTPREEALLRAALASTDASA